MLKIAEILLPRLGFRMGKFDEQEEYANQSDRLVDRGQGQKIEGSTIVENGEAAEERKDDWVESNSNDLSLFARSDVAGQMSNC